MWLAAFALSGALVVARNLVGLASAPPGLYVDEASVGYNAWTVAHYGVDEHGFRLPLFFAAFGEYKNPAYIYALASLLRLLPLTTTAVRLPAAVFGALTVLFLTLAAWRVSRSRPITLFALALAALTPWLVQDSRLGFEVSALAVLLAAGLWCLSGEPESSWRFLAAGMLFGLAVYGYTTARLEILLFAVAFVVAYGWRGRHRGPWLFVAPILVAYAALGLYALRNPGALTARFGQISIAADGASLPTLIVRFVGNYLAYLGPDFLFIGGDRNPRHNTGFSGMLPAIMLPLLLIGLWTLWRRRGQRFPRFLALCLVLSPVGAALTGESVPHSLRAADMMPLLLLLATYGLLGARELLADRRRATAAVAASAVLALLAQESLYTLDMYTAYPVRAALAFDTGVEPAIAAAAASRSGGHVLYISSEFEAAYIQGFFALRPRPPATPVDNASRGLAALHARVVAPDVATALARPGDVLVLGGDDRPPRAAFQLVDVEYAPQNPFTPHTRPVLVYAIKLR